MRPRKNNTPEGIFGTQGFINPRARRREIGDSEFSVSRLMRTIGEALKERERRKEAERAKDAEGELYSSGEAAPEALREKTGENRLKAVKEPGQRDHDLQPSKSFIDSESRRANSLGDMLLEAARESEERKQKRQRRNKKTARAFENRAQFGARNPDTGVVNNPFMLAAARYFDRRSQKIKSRRDPRGGSYGGHYEF